MRLAIELDENSERSELYKWKIVPSKQQNNVTVVDLGQERVGRGKDINHLEIYSVNCKSVPRPIVKGLQRYKELKHLIHDAIADLIV